MKNDLVSIIIPCYNASDFITDTLNSILMQKNVEIEVIIVNDGSTDNSEQKIRAFKDSRISYFYQVNSGVSAARNFGFSKSHGTYVIFFDADDLMTEDFIYTRLKNLMISGVDFISGEVKKITYDSVNMDYFRGTSSNIVSEILLYDLTVITCPSNYIFKTNFLKEHNLNFNIFLSSTADRYFLLECARVGKTDFIKECAELLYRVSTNSMSHSLSEKLVNDNEVYYDFLIKNNLIPSIIKNKSLFLGYYMLSGANYRIKKVTRSIMYGVKALRISPFVFFKKVLFV